MRQSLQLLEEVGVVIGSENVRKMLEAKGAKVIGENVRFPKAMTEEMLGLIVHTFPIGAYTEAYRKQVPSITHPFSTTAGYVPYIYDEDTGKNRYATEEDFTPTLRSGRCLSRNGLLLASDDAGRIHRRIAGIQSYGNCSPQYRQACSMFLCLGRFSKISD